MAEFGLGEGSSLAIRPTWEGGPFPNPSSAGKPGGKTKDGVKRSSRYSFQGCYMYVTGAKNAQQVEKTCFVVMCFNFTYQCEYCD